MVKSCNCMDLVDTTLSHYGARVGRMYNMKTGQAYPHFVVESVVKLKRGLKPPNLVASYCPWCGKRYDMGDEVKSNG